jgi:hypothetical protein
MLALRLSVKAKFDKIPCSLAEMRETCGHHGCRLCRKPVRVWAGQLHARYLAQTGRVLRSWSLGAWIIVWPHPERKIEQHRFGEHIAVCGDMESERCRKL